MSTKQTPPNTDVETLRSRIQIQFAVIAICFAVMVIALGFLVYAIIQRNDAQDLQTLAEDRADLAETQSAMDIAFAQTAKAEERDAIDRAEVAATQAQDTANAAATQVTDAEERAAAAATQAKDAEDTAATQVAEAENQVATATIEQGDAIDVANAAATQAAESANIAATAAAEEANALATADFAEQGAREAVALAATLAVDVESAQATAEVAQNDAATQVAEAQADAATQVANAQDVAATQIAQAQSSGGNNVVPDNTLNASVGQNIGDLASGTRDGWTIDLTEGQALTVETDAIWDTVLSVRGPNGAEVAFNDDADYPDVVTSRVEFAVAESGTYIIIVEGYDFNAFGSYTLSISIDDDGDTPIPDTNEVPAPPTGEMVITQSGHYDETYDADVDEIWQLPLSAGQTITVDIAADWDTTLTLNGPDGSEVAFNDDVDYPDDNTSLLDSVAIEADGTYELVVGSFLGDSEGDYTLIVTIDGDAAPTPEDNEAQTMPVGEMFITEPGQYTGDYDNAIDEIWLIDLTAGQSVTVDIEADWDTTLTLNDPNGREVAYSDDVDYPDDSTSLLENVAIEADGTYQLVVGSFLDRPGGSYTLIVTIDGEVSESSASVFNIAGTGSYSGDVADGERDIWVIELAAGQLATIDIVAEWDTTLALYDANNVQLAYNDDADWPDDRSSILRNVYISQAGTYELDVVGFDDDDGGTYTLDVVISAFSDDEIAFATGSFEGSPLVVESESGTLTLEYENFFDSAVFTGIADANFVLDVDFEIPDSNETAFWTFSVIFRETSTLFIASDSYWLFSVGDPDNSQESIAVDDGFMTNMNLQPGETNTLRVIVESEQLQIVMNGDLVAIADASIDTDEGEIALFANLLEDVRIPGYEVPYENLSIRTLQPQA